MKRSDGTEIICWDNNFSVKCSWGFNLLFLVLKSEGICRQTDRQTHRQTGQWADKDTHTHSMIKLTVIWLSPVNLIVKVEETKYLNANSRLSLSKLSGASIGSLMALHIISAMSRALVLRSSLSGSLHKYLSFKWNNNK